MKQKETHCLTLCIECNLFWKIVYVPDKKTLHHLCIAPCKSVPGNLCLVSYRILSVIIFTKS